MTSIRLSAARKLPEPGKFGVFPLDEQSVQVQGFLTKTGLYLSPQSHDALERVRKSCVDAFVLQSGKWFSRELTESAVQQRFQFISTKWTEATDLPAWAYEMYPYLMTGVQGLPTTGDEIAAELVLTRIVITPTLFHAEFEVRNVRELIEKIPIEDEPVDAPLEILEEATAEATLAVVENDDGPVPFVVAETENTRVVRLERSTQDEDKQRAKERLRRAKIRALLEKLRAEAEEDEYLQQYPDSDGDVLSDEDGTGTVTNVVVRKTD